MSDKLLYMYFWGGGSFHDSGGTQTHNIWSASFYILEIWYPLRHRTYISSWLLYDQHCGKKVTFLSVSRIEARFRMLKHYYFLEWESKVTDRGAPLGLEARMWKPDWAAAFDLSYSVGGIKEFSNVTQASVSGSF